MTRVAIIGGSPIYRQALERLLAGESGFAVVATAPRADAGADLVRGLGVDVVVLELETQDDYGALARVRRTAPSARLVVVGAECPDGIAFCASAGVVGYLPRDASLADLTAALRAVAEGEVFCPPPVVAKLLEAIARRTRRPVHVVRAGLTQREREVAELIGMGLSNKQIAQQLCIEVATVKSHVHSILGKLNVARRSEAVAVLHSV